MIVVVVIRVSLTRVVVMVRWRGAIEEVRLLH